ncbi:MAG: metallophosphoesterase [Acidobacteriaceae bacterium]|nr:metallophosphoesterase [Acidobacteriaceae bacterium]MBV9780798.1 metallophosphoesterase [Acidobacteriaceae bacterium]
MFHRGCVLAVFATALFTVACSTVESRNQAADLETGPLFRIEEHAGQPLTVITYGDTRFTDPQETEATNPQVRRWLVDKIASEHPDALLLSGDVPWHGGNANDYTVFRDESRSWRDQHIFLLPALGNHEFSEGSEQTCLQHWWTAFPELRGRRYYAAQIGAEIYALNLDTELSLLPGSEQAHWIANQLANLPSSVKWVFINLHHPPVADFQANGDASHNPRPNEIALAGLLENRARSSSVKFIVVAGHIHNYERFLEGGVVYMVSGGGGAKPRPIVRSREDLFQDTGFPNYHYIKFVKGAADLDAVMIRVVDPNAPAPSWETKDHFQIPSNREHATRSAKL